MSFCSEELQRVLRVFLQAPTKEVDLDFSEQDKQAFSFVVSGTLKACKGVLSRHRTCLLGVVGRGIGVQRAWRYPNGKWCWDSECLTQAEQVLSPLFAKQKESHLRRSQFRSPIDWSCRNPPGSCEILRNSGLITWAAIFV